MKVYLVGGAVRDNLLGLPVHDKDWVVVGATSQQMLDAGYKSVGKDFPVFLHPKTHEEVALARTERKTGTGYQGFAVDAEPTVTLEEDLARRDLTINAIAQDEQGVLIDPYHGQRDLQDKILRHVTGAFAEDPVRILRVGRFAARYADFSVAPETMVLMQDMVCNGEVDALVAERIWQELAKGLTEKKPSRMFDVLQACGALARVLPEVTLTPVFLAMLDQAVYGAEKVEPAAQLCISTALLAYAVPTQNRLLTLCQRLRLPSDCKALLMLAAKERTLSAHMDAEGAFDVLSRCDAIRQPERFKNLVQVAGIAALCHNEEDKQAICKQAHRWLQALQAVLGVQTAPIAERAMMRGAQGAEIGRQIDAQRLQVLRSVW